MTEDDPITMLPQVPAEEDSHGRCRALAKSVGGGIGVQLLNLGALRQRPTHRRPEGFREGAAEHDMISSLQHLTADLASCLLRREDVLPEQRRP